MQGKTGAKPVKRRKKLAATPEYVSQNQLTLPGFETPFEKELDGKNRWVQLAAAIPWDKIVSKYDKLFTSREGRQPISGRIILGSVIIKHLGNLTDRETIAQIQENVYLQHFLGYSSFTTEAPFSPTLFVEIRDRLGMDLLSEINETIVLEAIRKGWDEDAAQSIEEQATDKNEPVKEAQKRKEELPSEVEVTNTLASNSKTFSGQNKRNKGKLLMDATVAPQNITFPTDLKLLNAARVKSEQLIDKLYNRELHGAVKVRTYRNVARRDYLNAAKRKRKTRKQIYKFNGQQIRYLRRNLRHIDTLLERYDKFPLNSKEQKYLMVLHTVYEQQKEMFDSRTHRIEHRIVNIHQPHVRPIVRGKENARTEFGGKMQVSLVSGFAFIDHFDWEAFNEGTYLVDSIEKYKDRFGFYPKELLADKIYCTRANRKQMKALGVHLAAKPLGRPIAGALQNHVRPGERNPIEGKFGQAKVKYGMENIRAKLATTSTSWVASIAIVLNLINLMGQVLVSLLQNDSRQYRERMERIAFRFWLPKIINRKWNSKKNETMVVLSY